MMDTRDRLWEAVGKTSTQTGNTRRRKKSFLIYHGRRTAGLHHLQCLCRNTRQSISPLDHPAAASFGFIMEDSSNVLQEWNVMFGNIENNFAPGNSVPTTAMKWVRDGPERSRRVSVSKGEGAGHRQVGTLQLPANPCSATSSPVLGCADKPFINIAGSRGSATVIPMGIIGFLTLGGMYISTIFSTRLLPDQRQQTCARFGRIAGRPTWRAERQAPGYPGWYIRRD